MAAFTSVANTPRALTFARFAENQLKLSRPKASPLMETKPTDTVSQVAAEIWLHMARIENEAGEAAQNAQNDEAGDAVAIEEISALITAHGVSEREREPTERQVRDFISKRRRDIDRDCDISLGDRQCSARSHYGMNEGYHCCVLLHGHTGTHKTTFGKTFAAATELVQLRQRCEKLERVLERLVATSKTPLS